MKTHLLEWKKDKQSQEKNSKHLWGEKTLHLEKNKEDKRRQELETITYRKYIGQVGTILLHKFLRELSYRVAWKKGSYCGVGEGMKDKHTQDRTISAK